jgi:hypothetical protein
MKYTLVFISLFFTCFSAFSQVNPKLSADSLINYQLKGDYLSYAKMNIPQVVELSGGAEIFAKNIGSMKESWKQAGFITKEISFLEAGEILKKETNHQLILSYKVVYSMGENEFVGKINLLAISEDAGTTWKFLDLESYDLSGIKEFVSNYNDNLIFPVFEAPVMVEK